MNNGTTEMFKYYARKKGALLRTIFFIKSTIE